MEEELVNNTIKSIYTQKPKLLQNFWVALLFCEIV